ncbi:replicative DNA helicase [Chromobacterium haemolyticum]|uniref:replicative DNA helicase n=1 Tax=Chromobacterium haemolyticum TaxID=394935 RepID=UPI00244CCEBC|nr:replicative DNA helicase [Chromobacterium haemolyticum]MDH0341991.1 replicative DNA helicase [Chromobacterium haemolyticum]
MQDSFRLPPQSIEAEQSVLGGLLLENDAWDTIADIVRAEDFYLSDHRLIFKSICRLIELSHPADVVTVSEALTSSGDIDEVGGLAYLATMAQNTPSAANIKRYAQIVREKSILRQLGLVATEISDSVFSPNGRDAAEMLDIAEAKIFAIAEGSARNQQGGKDMPELLKAVVEEIDERYQSDDPNGITGIATGFKDFNKMTRGLQPGDLIIVAGRPSMGKTSFAINIAEHVGVEEKLPVVVFSMEMPAKQLTYRMLSSIGRIDSTRLMTGQLEDDDWNKLTNATVRLSDAPIRIDDSSALTALEVRARARRFKRQSGGKLGLIVVDYIQLMASHNSHGDQNRAGEVGEISRGLKNLAKELEVPVIALSQLSRKVEERSNKRPMMSDLRESGALEQDADVIVFLYRDEYYNADSEYKGLAEAIIGKHRSGPTGKVPLAFIGNHSRFADTTFKLRDDE